MGSADPSATERVIDDETQRLRREASEALRALEVRSTIARLESLDVRAAGRYPRAVDASAHLFGKVTRALEPYHPRIIEGRAAVRDEPRALYAGALSRVIYSFLWG